MVVFANFPNILNGIFSRFIQIHQKETGKYSGESQIKFLDSFTNLNA